MNDPDFLRDLALRLELVAKDAPNVHLHWLDPVRLRLVAGELAAKQEQITGLRSAIDSVMGTRP